MEGLSAIAWTSDHFSVLGAEAKGRFPINYELPRVAAPALDDSSIEQPLASGGANVPTNAEPSSTFPKDRYARRVTTKMADVVSHPLQGKPLVEGSSIAKRAVRIFVSNGLARKKPEDIDSVVHRDNDDVVLFNQVAAVVPFVSVEFRCDAQLELVAVTDKECTTVQPHHDRDRRMR